MALPFISVLIPFKTMSDFVLQSVQECLDLNYNNFHIILLPDGKIQLPFKSSKIRTVHTGAVSAAAKRNIGLLYCKKNTRWVACIDSDAYPDRNWLLNAVKYFQDPLVMAVGGPNIAPPNPVYARKITGLLYEQRTGFGDGAFRHKPSKSRFVGELPTCNLIIRKSFFEQVQFDESFLAAEDNMLCHQMMARGYKIFFAEDVVVMHHRRKIFLPMMKQSYYYGYFRAKLLHCTHHYPVKVFLPSLFLLYLSGLLLILCIKTHGMQIPSGVLGLYVTTVLSLNIIYVRNPLTAILTTLSTLLCHISYGLGFINYFYYSIKCYCRQHISFSAERQKLSIPVNE